MAKRSKWISPLLGIATILSPLAIVVACGQSEQKQPETGGEGDGDNGIGGDSGLNKPSLDLNQRIERQQQLVDFNNRVDQILKTDLKRQNQVGTYETTITSKYGDAFKYPAFDFSYEQGKDGMQGFYQEINGERVNAMDLVYNERVQWQNAAGQLQTTKYNDVNFILNEIRNGNLKKHPAADRMFAQQISPDLNAISKGFAIGGNIKGPNPLGLYLAPGEIATITFSQKTVDLMKKQNINDLTLMINGSFWDNYEPTDAGRISTRYPFMMSEFRINVNDLIANGNQFQFGSPFGGTIDLVVKTKLKNPDANPFYPSYENFEFKIDGALETLLYVHGKTTKADWDRQVKKIMNDEIQAPNMAIDFAYGSIWFQSTGEKQFVGIDADKMIFPEAIMNRWTDFLFLSNLFASRDVNDSVVKIHFRFNDDIKSGGAAWGGGDQFKAPLSEAATGFLKGDSGWTISGQWLIFHEINHNFQQNGVLFRKRSHAETNQVSMFNLSVISDDGRLRNPYNWTGNYSSKKGPGWNRVQSGFASNRWMEVNNFKGSDSEYEIQNHLLQLVGTFRFLEYVQQDAAIGQNGASDWTGFQEMVDLSNFYQLNFWPAFQKFSSWWYDTWPTTYAGATDQQKAQIDQLNQKYKAFDFVANVYAAGNYLWDEQSQSYVYTADMQVPIDVSATGNYYFDFEKGINAARPGFQWNQLKFDAKTKLGGILKVDPRNEKNLIYQPPRGHEGQIDEFDMAIVPNYESLNDGATYVDQYGFKIKMFLNPRGPVVSLYQDPLTNNSATFATDELAYMTNEDNVSVRTISNPARGIIHDQLRYSGSDWDNKEWQRMRISFDFVAPQAGNYKFSYRGDARVFVTKDNDQNKIWFDGTNHVASQAEYTIDQAVTLQANESVHFDFYISANPNKTRFQVNATHQASGTKYDAYANSTVGNLTISNASALNDDQYQYHHRKIDLNQFQTKLFGNRVPNTSIGLDKTDQKQGYQISFADANFPIGENDKKAVDGKLSAQDGNVWEVWGPKNGQSVSVSFAIDFFQPQTLGAIIIGHRTNNHPNARPTKIKVVDQADNVLYDGGYGLQFNDRGQAQAITNFDYLATGVSKLIVTLTNETIWGPNQSALSLDHIAFTNQQNVGLNKVLSMLDPVVNYYGDDWKRINNDPDTILANVNFGAIQTKSENHYLEFNLFATGFDLIGQQLPEGGQFELYINDQLIGNYSTSGQIRNDNAILATYQNANPMWMKIKIINKSAKVLRLNYIQTYGKHVEWKA